MDLDERAVKIFAEAEALSETDLRGALAKMREAFAIEPDYPNLEDEIFIREDAITKLDGVLEFIVVLLREGKDYQACEMLQSLPDNYIIQDKSGLVGGLVDKITKVQGLVEQARELAKSNCVKALSLFEEAFESVSDYPGLSEDVAALKQDVVRYNSFISAIEKALKEKDADKATNFLVNLRAIYPDDENVSRFKVAIVNLGKDLKKKKHKKVNLLKIIAAVGSVLGVVGGYFAYEMVMIKQAGQQWQEVNRLLAAQNFTETQAACRDISQKLGRVRLFFLTGKRELQDKVDDVLRSELVVKGAEGKVLFDGDYIPKEQLASSKGVKDNIEEARALTAAGNYLEAIHKFEDALAATAGMDAKASAEVIDDIKLAITGCRLNIVRDLAAKAGALLATGSPDAALAGITEALAMVTEHALDASEPVVVKVFAVEKEINQAKLKGLIAGGDKLFIAGSYDNAIKAYNKAHAFAKANELGSDSLNRQIYGMINKSKVKGVMGSGDSYLASGKWQEAARAYENGIALARKADLQDLPSFQRAQINLQKAKIMQEVAGLDRQNKLARQHFKANKRKKATNLLKQAIKAGEGSEWREEKEVAAVLAQLKSGLAELEETIFVDAKKKFLRERYAAILKKDFGLGGGATLLDPQVILLAATPELLKFRVTAMSYTKSGAQGKYSRYEAIYAFDRQRETWGLVDKSSDR